MKILMVGDGNHYFNKKLVENLKKKFPGYTIDFFSTNHIVDFKGLPYAHIYDGSIKREELPFFFRVRGVFGQYVFNKLSQNLFQIITNNHYDYVHLQSANPWIYKILKKPEFENLKLIVTIWGSDFYRASAWIKIKMKDIFKRAEEITFASSAISRDFNKVYCTEGKHEIVKFGLDLFEFIDLNRTSVLKSSDKIIITIGYNRQPGQQHIKIIKSLKALRKDIKDKAKFIIPFTYGPNNERYYRGINTALRGSGIEYEFLHDFLTENQLATIRLQSDIMIQVQVTDAFSGSMQEYLYADNAVITGSWLPYSELREQGIKFYTVDDIEELPDRITALFEDLETLRSDCANNRKMLKKMSSWESNIIKWGNLYR